MRLRSAVPDLPKCLAPIAGRPFLEWQLRSLVERGVESFVLALGYGAEHVLRELENSWANSLSIRTVTEQELLGTGGAALFAMQETGLEEVLIANGDTFVGGSLQEMLLPLDLNQGELMRIATVQVTDRSRFGGVSVNADKNVIAFLEKGQAGGGLINAGLYRIHHEAFGIEAKRYLSMETQVMPNLIINSNLKACEVTGPFVDIGVPEDYNFFDRCIFEYFHKT